MMRLQIVALALCFAVVASGQGDSLVEASSKLFDSELPPMEHLELEQALCNLFITEQIALNAFLVTSYAALISILDASDQYQCHIHGLIRALRSILAKTQNFIDMIISSCTS